MKVVSTCNRCEKDFRTVICALFHIAKQHGFKLTINEIKFAIRKDINYLKQKINN